MIQAQQNNTIKSALYIKNTYNNEKHFINFTFSWGIEKAFIRKCKYFNLYKNCTDQKLIKISLSI
jgi:hypothetical protein